MIDFHPGSLKLSAAAKQVISRLDEALQLYITNQGKKPKHVHLYKNNYESLDKSLRNASKGKLSLEKNSYKGVLLLFK